MFGDQKISEYLAAMAKKLSPTVRRSEKVTMCACNMRAVDDSYKGDLDQFPKILWLQKH